MKRLTNKILTKAAIVIAVVATSAPSWGQMLGTRKYGTVLEQLQQSSLYQPIDSAVLAATDYVQLYRNTACFWKDGLKGSFESRDSIAEHRLITKLLNFAASFTGTRYRYGATGPKAFDCSGFTSFVFGQFGYALNRSSHQQINNGEQIERNNLRPGDLVFFNGRAVNSKRIGHVGIVTEVDSTGDGFSFIHASTSQGVCISKSDDAYYSRRYIGACRPIKK